MASSWLFDDLPCLTCCPVHHCVASGLVKCKLKIELGLCLGHTSMASRLRRWPCSQERCTMPSHRPLAQHSVALLVSAHEICVPACGLRAVKKGSHACSCLPLYALPSDLVKCSFYAALGLCLGPCNEAHARCFWPPSQVQNQRSSLPSQRTHMANGTSFLCP